MYVFYYYASVNGRKYKLVFSCSKPLILIYSVAT